MKKQIIETKDFRWTYWPNEHKSSKTVIVALGGASDKGPLFTATVKTMHKFGCNAATFVPVLGNNKYDGWHDFPLISQLIFSKMWAVEKSNPKECKAARTDIDAVCRRAIERWQRLMSIFAKAGKA